MPTPRPGRAKTIIRVRQEDFHYAQVWKIPKCQCQSGESSNFRPLSGKLCDKNGCNDYGPCLIDVVDQSQIPRMAHPQSFKSSQAEFFTSMYSTKGLGDLTESVGHAQGLEQM
ncbi:hypothetical protein N7494_005356 [Penicillium frequentans]|uniref:Uncharacterized protein n=1 Tax=Penicillium frequentans TaxID=3151616 RepID=A0AAD6CZ73_9EURO|nr:hypothetical protein N7494_005356 [Penicillium glabrum]